MRFIEFFVTGAYSGYSPVSPGTAGSLALLAIWYAAVSLGMPAGLLPHIALCVLCSVAGIAAVRIFLSSRPPGDGPAETDPQLIVIDEWAGMLIALTNVDPGSVVTIIAAFALFRAFDILKPGPVSWAENLPGAWGIMLDDIIAGLLAALFLQIGLLGIAPSGQAEARADTLLASNAGSALSGSGQARSSHAALPDVKMEIPTHLGVSGIIAATLKSGTAPNRIVVLDLERKSLGELLGGTANYSQPVWSPDGTKIAFVSDKDGNNEIYVANHDGSDPVRLTNNSVDDGDPAWSPDGKLVAFYSETGKSTSNLFATSPASPGRVVQLTRFSGYNSTPNWSPDGRMVTFSTNRNWPGWDICTFETATRFESCILQGHQTYCRPKWAHKSSKFAFSFGFLREISIGTLDVEKRQRKQVTNLKGSAYDPAWSPDDQYLLFVNDAERQDTFTLNMVDLKKGDIHVLLKAAGHSFRHPTWRAYNEAEGLVPTPAEAAAEDDEGYGDAPEPELPPGEPLETEGTQEEAPPVEEAPAEAVDRDAGVIDEAPAPADEQGELEEAPLETLEEPEPAQ